MIERIKSQLHSLATVTPDNGACFTVKGWPFAIIRNGSDAWDILSPTGLFEACPEDKLAISIAGFVEDAEAENGNWETTADDLLKQSTGPETWGHKWYE